MLVSLIRLRAGARHLARGALPTLAMAGCAGGDLQIPDDRFPVQLRALSGSGQTAVVGSPVPYPREVEALDGQGQRRGPGGGGGGSGGGGGQRRSRGGR